MKAWVHTEYGGPEVLHLAEVPKPVVTNPRDLLVKVLSVATNPVCTCTPPPPLSLTVGVPQVDVKKLNGFGGSQTPPIEKPQIVGWDGVGVVEAVGSEASLFKVGDHVLLVCPLSERAKLTNSLRTTIIPTLGVINRPGSFAEYTLVDERIVGHKPKTLSDEDAIRHSVDCTQGLP